MRRLHGRPRGERRWTVGANSWVWYFPAAPHPPRSSATTPITADNNTMPQLRGRPYIHPPAAATPAPAGGGEGDFVKEGGEAGAAGGTLLSPQPRTQPAVVSTTTTTTTRNLTDGTSPPGYGGDTPTGAFVWQVIRDGALLVLILSGLWLAKTRFAGTPMTTTATAAAAADIAEQEQAATLGRRRRQHGLRYSSY